jgi:D-arginine utilization repressor
MRGRLEVVVHDLQSLKIAHITGSFSGRKVGDASSLQPEETTDLDQDVIGPYYRRNPDGRDLTSVTAVIRNVASEPVALICVNMDTSLIQHDVAQLEAVVASLKTLAARPSETDRLAPIYGDSWQLSIDATLKEFMASRGLAPGAWDRIPARDVIDFLDQKNCFSLQRAIPHVAKLIGISRATVYKHLKASRMARSS